MSNPDTVTPSDRVTYWDDDGDRHEAVVIDVFSRPGKYGPYVNLVYNPEQTEFGANTCRQLDDATSVPHVASDGTDRERAWTTEWLHSDVGAEGER